MLLHLPKIDVPDTVLLVEKESRLVVHSRGSWVVFGVLCELVK